MAGRIVYLSDVPSAEGAGMFGDVPDVMDVGQVAGVLGVVPMTVRREIARGRLESIHVGTRVKVTKAALLRYVGEEKA